MEKTVCIWGAEPRFANYRRWVEEAGGRPAFGAGPEKCGALLLCGGGDMEPWRYGQENTASRDLEPERDAVELELLEAFAGAGKPVLGVCRGLQVINVFFGGTLAQDVPGHNALENGADRRHGVRTAPSPLLAACGEALTVNSAHHQAADRLGSGLRAVQWAGDGVVEALCHARLPVWGVQWHPERVVDRRLALRLLRAFLAL